jgi:hypothetical protein
MVTVTGNRAVPDTRWVSARVLRSRCVGDRRAVSIAEQSSLRQSSVVWNTCKGNWQMRPEV